MNPSVNQPISTAPKAARAFTLIEMLVVIAIIGILAALLLPVLNRSKQEAQGTYCVNNLSQMQIAWTLYTEDSAQVLVPNLGDRQAGWGTNTCWVAGDVSSLPDETNDLLISSSLLGPYTKSVAIYKCPADPGNPPGTQRVRSISMNNYMHGKGIGLNDDFVQNIHSPDIAQPSSAFVFLDERSSTVNDGYFVMLLTTNYDSIEANDLPANYHNLAGGLSFADGHAQIKKWQTEYFQDSQSEPRDGIADNTDYIWMMQNTTVPVSGTWPNGP